MRKFTLMGRQMSAAEYVGRAAFWSREMTRWRSRGPGDLDNAMRSIERDYGLDYWLLWRLRYRINQIRTIGVDIYVRLEAAYHSERERQRDKLAEQIARAAPGTDADTLDAAACVVGRSSRSPTQSPLHGKDLATDDENSTGKVTTCQSDR